MKKATLSTVVALLSGLDFENKEELMGELNSELNRGAEEKAAKTAEYDAARPVVLEAMEIIGHPATASDIFAEAEKDLPFNFSKARLQYGLTHYWEDIIVKYDGKPCTYYFKD